MGLQGSRDEDAMLALSRNAYFFVKAGCRAARTRTMTPHSPDPFANLLKAPYLFNFFGEKSKERRMKEKKGGKKGGPSIR